MPVADGGEGTLDVLCSRVRAAVRRRRRVRAAARCARGLVLAGRDTRSSRRRRRSRSTRARLDVMARVEPRARRAGSRELERRAAARRPSAARRRWTAGAGLLEVLDRLPGPTRVLCDVRRTLLDAPRLFGPQKGATPEQVAELEARFRATRARALCADLPGVGRGRRARGGARRRSAPSSCPGADAVLDLLGFDPRGLRPRRHRRGHGRRDDLGGQGAGGRRAPLRRGRRPLRRLRRRVGACRGRGAIALSGDPARARGRPRRARGAAGLGLARSAARSRFAMPWSSSQAIAGVLLDQRPELPRGEAVGRDVGRRP